jgi:hypothetical protein
MPLQPNCLSGTKICKIIKRNNINIPVELYTYAAEKYRKFCWQLTVSSRYINLLT